MPIAEILGTVAAEALLHAIRKMKRRKQRQPDQNRRVIGQLEGIREMTTTAESVYSLWDRVRRGNWEWKMEKQEARQEEAHRNALRVLKIKKLRQEIKRSAKK